jgi:hypothetical protein
MTRFLDRMVAWWKRNGSRSLAVTSAITGAGWESALLAEIPSPTSSPPPSIENRASHVYLFPDATTRDVHGSESWRYVLDDLAARLEPEDERLLPYYVPTLFVALANPANAELRESITPIDTPEMEEAYRRGRSIRVPSKDLAVVVDLPGPDAIAFSAALADRFIPVFDFDNVPHPAGVVPAHETLAAVLFELPRFENQKRLRPRGARPMFVLDANRDNFYAEETEVFDNRYPVKMPDCLILSRMGIRRLLYVYEDGEQIVDACELDDLVVARNPFLDELEPTWGFVGPPNVIALDNLWWTSGTAAGSEGWIGGGYWGGSPGRIQGG